jgi:predicted RNase H-like nuclease (RuvC/YqgF family)
MGLTNLATLASCIHAFHVQNDTGNNMDSANAKRFAGIVSRFTEFAALDDSGDEEEGTENEALQRALKQLDEHKKSLESSKANLQFLLDEKTSLIEKREKRNSRKQSLQAQCDRLETDVQTMRSQIDSLRQRTEEAREMSAVFKKGK